MINYTKEQKEAIEFIDNNLLISASAGSGKTQVLLEKVIFLIEKGFTIDEILMVTFTNLAASEMKSKLENLLNEKFNQTGDDKFFNAIKSINSSDISTMHSFCQKLVKKYYYFLKIEPNFNISDENYLNILKDLSLTKTIEDYLSKKDLEFIELSNLFVTKRDYSKFKEEILNFYNFLVSKPNKYNFIEELINKSYNKNLSENFIVNKFLRYFNDKISNLQNKIKALSFEAELLKSNKLIDICNSIYNLLSFKSENFSDLTKYFPNINDLPRVVVSKNATYEEDVLKEKLQDLKKEIKLFLTTVFEMINFSDDEKDYDFEQGKKLLFKFVEVIKTFENNFSTLKNERNLLDFNDLETLTLKLLDNINLSREITEKFKFIFVDEYQDTNSIQEEILMKLAKNCKRIMVGDLKQSIYSFRECNPRIFNEKMTSYSSTDNGKLVKLNKNFRSINPILDFSNNIFANLMREENSGYDYKKDGMFICGREDVKTKGNIKPVSLFVVNSYSENIKDKENQENICVINAINNLLEQKITENNCERNLTYKDIAIISRSRNEKVKNLSKFLQNCKVPISIKYKEKIYKSFEVKLIISFLKIIDNLDDEISLTAILKNIYNFSDNDLLKIKKENLCADIFEYSENDIIKNKIDSFILEYNNFKSNSTELKVKDFVKYIIAYKKIDINLMKEFGQISAERLNIFINSISDSEYSLSSFLTYVDKLKDNNFIVEKTDSDNSVTIDTFHSTKGLEYNAVIIFNAGDSIFNSDSGNLIYNASIGVGIYKFNESEKTKKKDFVFSMISLLNKQEEFNEEVRLSYVAFTRAKYYLTIVGSCNTSILNEENDYVNFLSFKNYLNLVFSSPIDKNYVSVEIINDSCDFTEEGFKDDESDSINLDYTIFDKNFDFKYNYNNSTMLQLKNSVTGLSEEDREIYNITNFKISDNDKEDFALIGNCYHYVFEQLPFNLKTKNEVHNKISNLVENGMLPANVFMYVNEDKVLTALKCINGLVDKDSKILKEKIFMMYLPYNEIFKSSKLEDKILIQGIMDLVIINKDEIILIDYKTSRLNDYNLIKKYKLQLDIYEKALKKEFENCKVTKYIYSIFLDKLINIV